MLAGLDRHMLADIGITRADLRDAFSAPFWEDPTALLRERALERRVNRVHAARDASRAWRERLPPPAHRSAGAPGDLTMSINIFGIMRRNGRALSSAARSGTRDHPLSRPDQSARRPLRRAHSF